MATTPSIRVVKSFAFKGGVKRWSNRYHFHNGSPTDDAHWHTMMDNIVAAEKLIYRPFMTIVECLGYDAGSDMPVSSKTYAQAGTGSFAGTDTPGEVCGLVRYSTAARSVKNHPIYLFNYYHAPRVDASAYPTDGLSGPQQVVYQTYAAAWIAGFSDGTVTHHRTGPNGASATGYFVEDYVTHRDFPYSPSA